MRPVSHNRKYRLPGGPDARMMETGVMDDAAALRRELFSNFRGGN